MGKLDKEEIFSKLNIKDYNNQLEDILEKKSFSEGAKNILLNILYKMETAYEDYKKVKLETKLKKDILEEFIQIIEKDCKEIELIKPKLNEKTKLDDKKFIAKDNKVISYPNEKTVFYGIYHIKENNFIINSKNSILKEPMENLLNIGYVMDRQELIRDFDGWAWIISKQEIENYIYNIIYQNIKFLVGDKFLQECILNIEQIDFIDKFEKKINNIYTEEIANKIIEKIYILSILENIKTSKEKQKQLIEEKNNMQQELDKMNNKKVYLQEIANTKKIIGKQIKEIDEIINNNKKLREKFVTENEKLKDEEKIFSLSEYADKLQKKRKELLISLKNYSNLMKPMNYVKTKFGIQKNVDLLNKIDLTKDFEEQENSVLLELQINFLKAMQEKIGKVENKKRIIDYIYLIRYYKLLYASKDKQIKDLEQIEEQLIMAEKYIITRACNLKAINIISNNIEKNYEIVSTILNSNIIDLDEIYLEFKKKEEKIELTIYDDNMIDKTIEYNDKVDLNIKLNKKTRLFI
ncbi:MAG: hypothetical protein IJB90_00280 [Clostridia bacterium]|nr:hypothetical protein [Clostridia bacterium]